MEFDCRYKSESGIAVCLTVTAPASSFASDDEAALSRAETEFLVAEAFGQSIQRLSALLHPTIRQVEQVLLQSYTTSLQNWVKENAPPLDTPLAVAVAGEQRRQ